MSKVYEIVQERIVKDLEEAIKNGGTAPWRKPWNANGVPKNFITQKPYRGINIILLPFGGYYMSFKQIQELQKKHDFIKLKKGSKSFMVVFWTFKEQKPEEKSVSNNDTDSKRIPIIRYYNVFHQSQIEGFEELVPQEEIEVFSVDKADEFIDIWSKIVPIDQENLNSAYYKPSVDKIYVPSKECYKNTNEFYSTTFHEIIHSTGHSSRLARISHDAFGDKEYSKEELVAEIGSSMLGAEFNTIDDEVIENSNAYLYGWLSVIKKDVKLIVSAAQSAQKACDLLYEQTGIFGTSEETDSEKTKLEKVS